MNKTRFNGSSKEELEQALREIEQNKVQKQLAKRFDSSKHCGKVKFKEDGLVLQKKWRDEWE